MGQLQNKTALVTGGNSGIGLACHYLNVATAQDDVPWNSPVFAVPDGHMSFYWSS